MHRGLLVFAVLSMLLTSAFAQKASLYFDPSPQIAFAAGELEKSVGKANLLEGTLSSFPGSRTGVQIVLAQLKDASIVGPLEKEQAEKLKDLKEEGFSIVVSSNGKNKTVYVVGFDEPGLMYGTLELAEQISFGGMKEVKETKQNPYMKMRGVKFNIPLDVRTPSYTDASDAAQKNIAVMWDLTFWKAFIDHLARDRYNLISLWNLHPFPSMVKVPEYPDVALNDVQRTKAPWKEYNATNGRFLSTPDKLANVEVLKKMTIDDKIAFWRAVMKYGKERNVRFYIITWNVFVNGAEGKYGITDNYENPITTDYVRKSVKQMILTYPDLEGIGLTTGENFLKADSKARENPDSNSFSGRAPRATTKEKEDWAFDTFGQGVLDALKEQPNRKITFIHRQHQAAAGDILDGFQPLIENPNINFIFSFKYAQAHALSSTDQPFCNNFVKEIRSKGHLKTIWTLRNDDNYYFRWGAPDFVREFIKKIPYDVSEGFYYGSDGWIWGREFVSRDPQNSGQLEVEKHWYHWMLWGRLGYNPELNDEAFVKMIARQFPGAPAEKLFDAWQNASMIYPTTTGFHWGAMDFQWYIEGCKRYPKADENSYGFQDVNNFITVLPHPGTNNQSIPEYVGMLKSGGTSGKISPFEVSKKIDKYAGNALSLLNEIPSGGNKELGHLLGDIKAMSLLGKYYALKVKAAAEVQESRVLDKGKAGYQAAAVKDLTDAAGFWEKYVALATASYKNPVWTNRVGIVDWKKIYSWVLSDIEIAKSTK